MKGVINETFQIITLKSIPCFVITAGQMFYMILSFVDGRCFVLNAAPDETSKS